MSRRTLEILCQFANNTSECFTNISIPFPVRHMRVIGSCNSAVLQGGNPCLLQCSDIPGVQTLAILDQNSTTSIADCMEWTFETPVTFNGAYRLTLLDITDELPASVTGAKTIRLFVQFSS